MGFYTQKLQAYKEGYQPLSLEERLPIAKEKAGQIMQQRYQKNLSDYNALTSSTMGAGLSAQLMGIYQQELNVLDAKIKATEEMPVEDYFSNLITEEYDSLSMYIISKSTELSTQMRTIGQINSFQPFTAFWYGVEAATQAEERANSLHEEALCNSAFEQEALVAKAEWEEMPVQDKLEYLVGRIEKDNLVSFDQAGLDAIGQARFDHFEEIAQDDASQQ